MYTIKDYNYQTTMSRLEAKIKIAASGANDIYRAAKELGEKHSIPEDELEKFREGIGDLAFYLEQK